MSFASVEAKLQQKEERLSKDLEIGKFEHYDSHLICIKGVVCLFHVYAKCVAYNGMSIKKRKVKQANVYFKIIVIV